MEKSAGDGRAVAGEVEGSQEGGLSWKLEGQVFGEAGSSAE